MAKPALEAQEAGAGREPRGGAAPTRARVPASASPHLTASGAWRGLRRWIARPWVRETLALFAATRVAFILITYVGFVLIQAPKYSTTSVGVGNLLGSWDQWDGLRYLAIATHGYTAPELTAFFPLYPLLVAVLGAPFGGAAAYPVALLISNAAFLGALLALRALVAARWGADVAARTALYLAVFPTALYTFAPYNESLFLLWSIGCFLALERRRWALAGVLGALAVLTRAAGILLLLPFAVEWWRLAREVRATATPAAPGGGRVARAWRTLAAVPWDAWARASWALLLPVALGAYSLYCALTFGDWLAWVHAQAHWNRFSAWPWESLWLQVVGLVQAAPASFYQAHDLLDLGATLLFIALLFVGWKRLPRAQSLYLAALLLLVLTSPGGVHLHTNDPLTSNQRFALEMFPGFITLALLTEQRPLWRQGIVIVSTMLLATLTLVFVLGRWLV
ncbi:MAG TPA: mannosyltransferase family protein [Ktedonobacterales bacterium]